MGGQAVEARLQGRRQRGEVGLIPYLTMGFPDVAATVELALAVEEAGADLLELGVPFSDPLADGVTIQRTSFHALRQGVTLAGCLETCQELRRRGLTIPVVLMGYYNPILAYGLERLVRDAAQAGVDGFIVADLPREEAEPFSGACAKHGLCNVPLLAPTSTEERVAQACSDARGFVYCVSLTGVTGARREPPSEALELVARVRRHTASPVAVGFGISCWEHVQAIRPHADAVVVGSALLEVIGAAAPEQRSQRAKEFLRDLQGLRSPVG